MRRSILLLLLGLTATACADDRSVFDDPARTRVVDLTVTVVDGRDTAGAPVVLRGYDIAEAGSVSVTVLDSGVERVAATCADAVAAATEVAERIGSAIDECRDVDRSRQFTVERLELEVGADGTVALPLLPDLTYEVGSFVEIVPGDDGCHWHAGGAIADDATDITLDLATNGCE